MAAAAAEHEGMAVAQLVKATQQDSYLRQTIASEYAHFFIVISSRDEAALWGIVLIAGIPVCKMAVHVMDSKSPWDINGSAVAALSVPGLLAAQSI